MGAPPPATQALNKIPIDNASKIIFMFHFLLSFPRMPMPGSHPLIQKYRKRVDWPLGSIEK
jgi:hypothetical protein